jgi:inositol polyphosphate 5-phosphatase INPP5B/F
MKGFRIIMIDVCLIIEGSAYSVAQCLLIFLESLADPVIPENLYNHCIEAASSYAQCKQIISSLKVVNYHTFWKIILFLRQLYKQSVKNKLTPQRIGMLFFFFKYLLLTLV